MYCISVRRVVTVVAYHYSHARSISDPPQLGHSGVTLLLTNSCSHSRHCSFIFPPGYITKSNITKLYEPSEFCLTPQFPSWESLMILAMIPRTWPIGTHL